MKTDDDLSDAEFVEQYGMISRTGKIRVPPHVANLQRPCSAGGSTAISGQCHLCGAQPGVKGGRLKPHTKGAGNPHFREGAYHPVPKNGPEHLRDHMLANHEYDEAHHLKRSELEKTHNSLHDDRYAEEQWPHVLAYNAEMRSHGWSH